MEFLKKFAASITKYCDFGILQEMAPAQLWQTRPQLAAIQALARWDGLDMDEYLLRYPDVVQAGMDPIAHFVNHGLFEGRSAKLRKQKGTMAPSKPGSKEGDSGPSVVKSGPTAQETTSALDYIVSLTSYPARIPGCHRTIQSLLEQNVAGNNVVLWLAREEFPGLEKDLPSELLTLVGDKFHIEWCDNLYSYKKLIPALAKYPDKVIITADDDVIYPQKWLQGLLDEHLTTPNEVLAYRGRTFSVQPDGSIPRYRDWPVNDVFARENSFFLPTGVGGVLYPPRIFFQDVAQSDVFLDICRHGDDLWFWAMYTLNGVRARCVEAYIDWNRLGYREGTQEYALYKNNIAGENDKMLKRVLAAYPRLMRVLKPDTPIQRAVAKADEPPNVSVVIPVYNTADYLEKCLGQILAQKNIRLEVFLVDDGSTDGSPQIIDDFRRKDRRITAIAKCNEGQGKARNMAMRLASGEFLYFMDSDDYLADNTLGMLYRAAKKHHLDVASPDIPAHYFDRSLNYISCIPNKAQFVRREIINKYNITQPHSRSGQDGVFSHLFLAHCKRIGMVKGAKHYYTTRPSGTFSIYATGRHDKVYELIESHYRHIVEHYDFYDLWPNNSLRLLWFMLDETLLNRIDKHYEYLSSDDKRSSFHLLKNIASKCRDNLTTGQLAYMPPALKSLLEMPVDRYIAEYKEISKSNHVVFPKHPHNNFMTEDKVYICKIIDESSTNPDRAYDSTKGHIRQNGAQPSVSLKLDYILNRLNNIEMNIINSIHHLPVDHPERGNNIVVSMTSLKSRLHVVALAIESVFNQSLQAEEIILWLSDNLKGQELPARLRALKARGLEIRYVRDVGPHTKLIYALKEFPDKNIVTVDDDIIYPRNTLAALYSAHVQYPHAIVANWARELAFDERGEVLPIRKGRLLVNLAEKNMEPDAKVMTEPSLLTFPYGTSGVLYPPDALHPKVFDEKTFKRLCPTEDDVWFKAMAILNGVGAVVSGLGMNPVHHSISGSQIDEALRYVNHGEGKNGAQLTRVFDELGLYDYLPKFGNTYESGRQEWQAVRS